MLQNDCLVTTRLFDEGSLDTREGHKVNKCWTCEDCILQN